jgi:hypothetical protein
MSVISLEELRLRREKRLASQSQSKQSTTSVKHGQIPTNFELRQISEKDIHHLISFFLVLDRSWRSPFKLKSNFARHAAIYVATSASLGYITNQVDHETFGSTWNISPAGADFLGELDEILTDITGQLKPDTTD